MGMTINATAVAPTTATQLHRQQHIAENIGNQSVAMARPASCSDASTLRPASFGSRAAAMTIDLLIMQTASLGLNSLLLAAILSNLDVTYLVLFATTGSLVANTLFTVFYCVWLESSGWQATLGKKLMGIKVVDLHGARIGFMKSSWRTTAKGMSILTLGIGYLMALWDHRNQTFHDKAAACLVVRATAD